MKNSILSKFCVRWLTVISPWCIRCGVQTDLFLKDYRVSPSPSHNRRLGVSCCGPITTRTHDLLGWWTSASRSSVYIPFTWVNIVPIPPPPPAPGLFVLLSKQDEITLGKLHSLPSNLLGEIQIPLSIFNMNREVGPAPLCIYRSVCPYLASAEMLPVWGISPVLSAEALRWGTNILIVRYQQLFLLRCTCNKPIGYINNSTATH